MQIQHSEFQNQLVRGLAHKMNNILSLFHGYLSMLMEDRKLDPELESGLARIKEGADAASELIDRAQALARPHTLVWREVDLCEFLPLLKSSFDACTERGVQVRLELPELLARVTTDPSRLRVALTEIVRNACEASPDGGVVEVILRSEKKEPKETSSAAQKISWVSILIADHGHGIPREIAPKIFQPFFSTRQNRNATGLGLTTAASLVQQLGGTIRFESKPGETVFQVLLPLQNGGF